MLAADHKKRHNFCEKKKPQKLRPFLHQLKQALAIKRIPMQFDTDMNSEHKELFLATQKLLFTFEGIKETKKERITTYSNENGGICHMRTMNHGLDIGLLKGVRMEDKFGLLSGRGKVMRVLSLELINEEHIEYYIKQAIEINAMQ